MSTTSNGSDAEQGDIFKEIMEENKSFKLCKELFERTRWKGEAVTWVVRDGVANTIHKSHVEYLEIVINSDYNCPNYSLEYLLNKLTTIQTTYNVDLVYSVVSKMWRCKLRGKTHGSLADTARDAVAKQILKVLTEVRGKY